MKAALMEGHGGPEVLQIGELPDPEPNSGEVVLHVKAVALNHLDLWVRRGLPGLDLEMPHVGGSDMAGIIARLGPNVSGWSEGDRVVVNPAVWCERCEWCASGEHSQCERFQILGEHLPGGLAEQARVPARNLLRLPDEFEFERAAAAPLVFQTAWRAVVTRGQLTAGDTLLVTGASGGVSTAAIQIGVLAGATVYAVTSGSQNVERVRELGAHVVIDRLEESFSRRVREETGRRGVDVIVDGVGESIWEDALRTLAPGGRLVTYGATTGPAGRVDIRRLFWRQAAILGSTMAGAGDFERVMGLVFDGRLAPVVDGVHPLERIREAHERLERGDVFGKLVLVP